MEFKLPGFQRADVYHMGIVVEDVEKAVETWSSIYGAGPFYYFSGAQFDELLFKGQPVTFSETSAYGKFGRFAVELQKFEFEEPMPELAELLGAGSPNRMNHAGFLSDDPAADSARLEALGLPVFMYGRLGDNVFYWHDAREQLGHFVEIFRNRDIIQKFHGAVARVSETWDGQDPLRRVLPEELQAELGVYTQGD